MAHIEVHLPYRTISATNGSGGTIELVFQAGVSGWTGLTESDVATVIKNAIDNIAGSTITSAVTKSVADTSF